MYLGGFRYEIYPLHYKYDDHTCTFLYMVVKIIGAGPHTYNNIIKHLIGHLIKYIWSLNPFMRWVFMTCPAVLKHHRQNMKPPFDTSIWYKVKARYLMVVTAQKLSIWYLNLILWFDRWAMRYLDLIPPCDSSADRHFNVILRCAAFEVHFHVFLGGQNYFGRFAPEVFFETSVRFFEVIIFNSKVQECLFDAQVHEIIHITPLLQGLHSAHVPDRPRESRS